MRRILTCGVVLSLVALTAVWFIIRQGDPNRIPVNWDLAEIAKTVPLKNDNGPVHILAWRIVVGRRIDPMIEPMWVERCLAIKEIDGGRAYQLAHVARIGKNGKWQLSWGATGHNFDPEILNWHSRRFDKRPSNRILYDSLGYYDVSWKFEHDARQTIDCGVCEKNWLDVTGEPPTKFYPKQETEGWFPWLRSKWRDAFGGAAP